MPILSFKKKVPEQHKLRDERVENAKTQAREATYQARRCLQTALFKEYLEAYQKAADSCLDVILDISISETDPVKFMFRVKDIAAEVIFLRHLISSIKARAGQVIPVEAKEDDGDES